MGEKLRTLTNPEILRKDHVEILLGVKKLPGISSIHGVSKKNSLNFHAAWVSVDLGMCYSYSRKNPYRVRATQSVEGLRTALQKAFSTFNYHYYHSNPAFDIFIMYNDWHIMILPTL